MKQLHTRKEKIDFLKDLQQGKANLNSIKPMTYETWWTMDDRPGVYIREEDGTELTEAEMKARTTDANSQNIIIHILKFEDYSV